MQVKQADLVAIYLSVSITKSPMEILTFRGHSERIVYATFSPDSQFIASASYDNTVKLWNPRTGEVIRAFSVELTDDNYLDLYPFSISSHSKLAFSQDGKVLVLGNGHNSIIAWQIDTGEIVQKLRGRTSHTAATAFSLDGNFFANALTSWYSGREGDNTDHLLERYAQSPLFNRPSSIVIWDVKTANQISTLSTTGLAIAIAFSFDHQFLASTNLSRIELWNLNSKQLVHQWTTSCHSVTISPNSQFVAGGSYGSVKVWNLNTGDKIHILQHSGYIESLVFSPDSILASVSLSEETIKLWNMNTGEEISTLPSNQVFSITISSNGDLIASSNFDHTVRVWRMP